MITTNNPYHFIERSEIVLHCMIVFGRATILGSMEVYTLSTALKIYLLNDSSIDFETSKDTLQIID